MKKKYISNILKICFIFAFFNLHIFSQAASFVGVDDKGSSDALDRINLQSTLLAKANYVGAVNNLLMQRERLKSDKYAISRIDNELADLFSNRTLDIESAIEIDKNLIQSISNVNENEKYVYYPRHSIANNRILIDKTYVEEYVGISNQEIIKNASKRLNANLQLITGKNASTQKIFPLQQLISLQSEVEDDLKATHRGTPNHNRLLSRMIRIDYEMFRLGNLNGVAYKYLLNSEININNIDFSEISFLALSDYLFKAYKKTGEIKLGEFALEAVYRPYINLRNTENRWRYNKLINEYITLLIDENFKVGRFDEAFYYISLNKSRMLLEERLAFSRTKGESGKISDLAVNDGVPRTAFGLPDKAWFKQQIAATPQFLDFYVGGAYKPLTVASAGKGSRGSNSFMPLNSRNAGLLVTGEPIDSFQDDALYSTKIEGGRVIGITKLSGSQLATLKAQMEKSYDSITEGMAVASAPELQRIVTKARPNDVLMVSSDKWMSKHPMDFHLGSKVVRSVNFFTAESSVKLNKLNVTGFFNPLLAGGVASLPGADKEAVSIKSIIPTASIIRHEGATLGALQQAESANVIHLSMHGQFNPEDATQSKLFFAGAKFDGSLGDSKALYAADMSKVAALSNRDLIFAAACQTGLSAADRSNENELIGMLRPLTANRNRNVILSLWSVSDEVTGEFVQAFYQKLATTQEITASFHFAQDQIKTKHPHPFYWAAFYLSQAK